MFSIEEKLVIASPKGLQVKGEKLQRPSNTLGCLLRACVVHFAYNLGPEVEWHKSQVGWRRCIFPASKQAPLALCLS